MEDKTENKWGIEEVHGVAVLNDTNFEDFINKHKYVFVDFYADWCGPCKAMAPAYAEVAKKMNELENPIPVVKIDASINKATGTKHTIQSYPTLRFFEDGKSIDYKGGRSTQEIYNFIRKKTGFASEEVKDLNQLKPVYDNKVAVMYYLPNDDKESLENYTKIASGIDDVCFFNTHNEEVAKQVNLSKKYGLVILKTFDDGNVVLEQDEKLTEDQIKELVTLNKKPLILKIEEAGGLIFNDQTNALIFVSDNKYSEELKTFENFVKKHKGDLIYSTSEITKGMGVRLASMLGITKKDDPCAFYIRFDDGKMLKYKVTDLSDDNLEKSLEDFKNNKLEAIFKSEEIPETEELPVKVVGKTFEELVLKSDKWVFLDVYAHWCGPCKTMAPEWKSLAEKLKDHKEVVIAKIDGSLNEHIKLKVNSYPTIVLYKPNSEEFVKFAGARNCSTFLTFLEEQMGTKLA